MTGSGPTAGQPVACPIWPEWLVKGLGPDYFGHVVSVSFTRRATDAELIRVGKLNRLERLDLYGSAVTDRGLAQLKGLTHLQKLYARSHQGR